MEKLVNTVDRRASHADRSLSRYTMRKFRRESAYYLMLLPALALILLFSYVPMGGLVIAFQRFIPAKGLFGNQKWVGWGNFEFIFSLPGFQRAFINTVIIAFWKIIAGIAVPLTFALLLNEVGSTSLRRSVQTMIYLPYFLSWVILGGVLVDLL
ncbi:MAG: sugar ABC transporter permease, partial [Clostridiales bacterium]|nr:sugar ABC transporter permease [Clostridiales bacterium]